MGLFTIFLYTFTINCVTTGAPKKKCLLLFCSLIAQKSFRRPIKCGLFSSVFKKIILNTATPTFEEVGGVT